MKKLEELSKEELILLIERMHQQLHRDSFTGLLNTRHFNFILETEVERSSKYGYEFCLLILDLDRFKQFNDVNGHAAGSRLLKSFADFLLENCRVNDFPFRYGGDEFTLLLPQTTKANGCRAAQNINRYVDGQKWLTRHHTVSVSIGVSSYPCDSDRPTELFEMADRAMYVAKAAGGGKAAAAQWGLVETPPMPGWFTQRPS